MISDRCGTVHKNAITSKPNPFKCRMIKDKLLEQMAELNGNNTDWGIIHKEMDRLLLEYIDDDRVTAAFKAAPKWYG